MEIIILALLGFGAYKLYRFVTVRMGLEAVRAYIYLEVLNNGATPEDANLAVMRITLEPNSVLMQNTVNMAAIEYRELHGGKQLPVIGHAYRSGLRSTMPFWYRASALATPRTLSVDVAYGALKPFNASDTTNCSKPLDYETYEDYRDEFLKILKTHFMEHANVERCVNAIRDTRIRAGYEKGLPPAVIAMQYRNLLAETLLSNDVRQ